jgi:hypothetical protein
MAVKKMRLPNGANDLQVAANARPSFFQGDVGRKSCNRLSLGNSPDQAARRALIDEKTFAFNYELSPNSR